MHPFQRLLSLLVGACLALGTIAEGQGDLEPGTLYALGPSSSFQEGCFEPCLCPILLIDDLEGQFVLRSTGEDGKYRTYTVSDLYWKMQRGQETVTISGSGTFRIGGDGALHQQLVLDLKVGGDPVERYDSGFVPAATDLPDIEVAVSRNGFYCYDRAFEVVATIRGPVQLPRASWGDVKSRFAGSVGTL